MNQVSRSSQQVTKSTPSELSPVSESWAAKCGRWALLGLLRSMSRYVGSLAEAMVGREFLSSGRAGPLIVNRLIEFGSRVPVGTLLLLVAACVVFPIPLWKRWRFSRKPLTDRIALLDSVRERVQQSPHPTSPPLIDNRLILGELKGVLSACFLELPEVWDELGYQAIPKVFPKDGQGRTVVPPTGPKRKPGRSPLSQTLEQSVKTPAEVAAGAPPTWCIIGSGAGGATFAHAILQKDPSASVVILEAGPLVPNDLFPERMLDVAASMMMDGGGKSSLDSSIMFNRGRVVGGSPTINNAICIKPLGAYWDLLKRRWHAQGVQMDWTALSRSYDILSSPELMNVGPVADHVISAGAKKLHEEGFSQVNWPGKTSGVTPANLQDCVGCLGCNLGCRYDAKRTTSTVFLPEAVEAGAVLVPEAEVLKMVLEKRGGSQRVTEVIVRDRDRRTHRILADRFVLAAGAISSTSLLWASGFHGAGANQTVGEGFTCNFASPIMGLFNETLGWQGQQISYVYGMPEHEALIEVAHAPPTLVGMFAPQWGYGFADLVGQYNQLVAAEPTIAATARGRIIRKQGLIEVDFSLQEDDWSKLAAVFRQTAHAFFKAGATRVFDTRLAGTEVSNAADIDSYYARIRQEDRLKVESSHLLGGQVMHPDPEKGVVDLELRAHGIENLWVADASVIPSAIACNAQLTVQALAHYAVQRL